jgi:hypothetical protein
MHRTTTARVINVSIPVIISKSTWVLQQWHSHRSHCRVQLASFALLRAWLPTWRPASPIEGSLEVKLATIRTFAKRDGKSQRREDENKENKKEKVSE